MFNSCFEVACINVMSLIRLCSWGQGLKEKKVKLWSHVMREFNSSRKNIRRQKRQIVTQQNETDQQGLTEETETEQIQKECYEQVSVSYSIFTYECVQ